MSDQVYAFLNQEHVIIFLAFVLSFGLIFLFGSVGLFFEDRKYKKYQKRFNDRKQMRREKS